MSSELQRVIISALIFRPALLEISDLTLNDFEGRSREVFSIITAFWEDEKPAEIDAVLLAQKLGGDDACAFIGDLLAGQIRIEPEIFIRRVDELKRIQISKRIVTMASKLGECHLKTGAFDEEGFKNLKKLVVQYDELGKKELGEADVLKNLKTGEQLQALDLRVEWLVDRLIPEHSITLFHGKGGIGKTWICLQTSQTISEGKEFFSMKTKSRPVVYIDFENPLSVVIDRARKIDIREVKFWHLSADLKPPKLDSPDYVQYRKLPPESLLIFDSLRSAHSGDENSSRDMSLVMERLKELRELGFTILVCHHSSKGNDRGYKGSTAISDLVDHVLSFYKIRPSNYEEIDDDLGPSPGDLFYFGTREKTRFEPFHLFLNFKEGGGFTLAEDPDIEDLGAVSEFIKIAGHPLTQTEIFSWVKSELGIHKKGKLFRILEKGEIGKRWISRKKGRRRLYEPF